MPWLLMPLCVTETRGTPPNKGNKSRNLPTSLQSKIVCEEATLFTCSKLCICITSPELLFTFIYPDNHLCYKYETHNQWNRDFILASYGTSYLMLQKSRNYKIITVETLYSTIYYSKYFIERNFDKFTQYVALWTHKRHPIPRPFGRAMECLLWVLQQKLTVL